MCAPVNCRELTSIRCLFRRSALGSSTEEGMDKFIKALRFVLGKQHEQAIHDDPESARRYHMLMGRLYQQLSDLTLEHPIEMFKCMQVHTHDTHHTHTHDTHHTHTQLSRSCLTTHMCVHTFHSQNS